MSPGLADLCRTARMPGLIFYMAWSDIRARYKRSVLGPLWITLSTAIGVVGMGFIWSALFKIDRTTYIPMLTVGLILWQFMSACINESTTAFTRQANIIRNLNLPLSLYPAQLVLRHVLNLAHNIPLFFIVALILGVHFNAHMLMAAPALLLVVLNLYWMSLLIGTLGARFRDLEYLVSMVMPLIMFMSPVMYRPGALPSFGKYMWFNPLADMIEIVRYPLLGTPTPMFIYAINIGMLAIGGALTFALFNAKRNRIAFWV
ncbi:MAG: ABC transporter permease [Alphaproteobacteria bacterium]|nr:ABC transporter permease [Alphaproteobacteria bacterium]